MKKSFKLPNPNGELLDCLIEGNDQAEKIIIFVHGFGTDKYETGGLFDDIAHALNKKHLTVRFDFSGYGQSQGKQEETNYRKQAKDLNAVLNWVSTLYPQKTKNILAQSMGCFVTALLSPKNVNKTILQSVPNADIPTMKRKFIEYFSQRNVAFNQQGITHIPRSSGQVQKLGPSFWVELDKFDSQTLFTRLAHHTQLLIIHPAQDEIIGHEGLEIYQTLPNSKYLTLPGTHSWSDPDKRNNLTQKINQFLQT
jgi:pimeloyl-ACP methyl ester carboxylesterase